VSSTKRLARFYFICFIFFGLLLTFAFRLIFIQVFSSQYLTSLASKQHNIYLEIPPQRGFIYDRNLNSLVVNLRSYSLFAVPNQIKNKPKMASYLHKLLNMDEDAILKKISSKKSFVWLKRKLPDQISVKIRDSKFDGLYLLKEDKRSLPNGVFLSHVLGFTNIDNVGLEGVELVCNNYLKGVPGYAFFTRDAHQNPLRLENADKIPQDGYDVVLTIDRMIQYIAESALDEAYRKNNAKGTCIVVMDPNSGEVLALANRPSFDPNNPQNSPQESRRNRAICDFFEPGSVFKIVTASAALEENTFTESDKIYCENGEYRVANHILHDHTSHGWLTFEEVIEQSSNIGVTKIAQQLGLEKVCRYAKSFGFGEVSNIGLPGESKGMLKPLSAYSKTSIGAVPMGHEVTVTTLQLASAISVIANGGLYYKPYIIKTVVDKYGEIIKEINPQCLRRVISEKTSSRMKRILTDVVEVGTGKLAKSKIYSFGGKTGTAQKIEPNGIYSHSKFFASFIGFAPADNPRLAIAVVMDEPHPNYYGGVVSAPVFKKVAEESLKYLDTQEKMRTLTEAKADEVSLSNSRN